MFRVSPPGVEPSRDTLPTLIQFSWPRRSSDGAESRASARQWLTARTPGGWISGVRATGKDVFHPVMFLGRGGRKASAKATAWWKAADWAKRRNALPLVLVAALVIWQLPYGLVLVALCTLAVLAWFGWDRAARKATPEAQAAKLQGIYDGLVPYLGGDNDPDGLFTRGGGYDKAFSDATFCADNHLTGLKVSYPRYFKVADPAERQQIERVIGYHAGGPNTYHVRWDPADKKLHIVALLTAPPGDPQAGPAGPEPMDANGVIPPLPPADGGDEHTLVLQAASVSDASVVGVPAVPVD